MRLFVHLCMAGFLAGVLGVAGCGSGDDDSDDDSSDVGDTEKQSGRVDSPNDVKPKTVGFESAPAKDRRTTDLLHPRPISDLSDIEQLNSAPKFLEARKLADKYADGKPRRELVIHRYQNGPTLFHGDYKEWHPNGRLWKQGKYDSNLPIGEWKFFAENGTLVKHAYYADSKPGVSDGQWTFYRDDATKRRVENWQVGKKHGQVLDFGEDGKQLILQQTFQNDLLNGPTVRWFPIEKEGQTPQKQLETQFVDDQQHGMAKEWHPDGQIKRQIEFRNGKRHGFAKEWDANGRIVLDLQFRDGELVKADN